MRRVGAAVPGGCRVRELSQIEGELQPGSNGKENIQLLKNLRRERGHKDFTFTVKYVGE